MTRFYGLPMLPVPARERGRFGKHQEESMRWMPPTYPDPRPHGTIEGEQMDVYAIVMGALAGSGWLTVEQVARRAFLPLEATSNTLTELVGEGKVLVKVDDNAAGAVLVYSDQPEEA